MKVLIKGTTDELIELVMRMVEGQTTPIKGSEVCIHKPSGQTNATPSGVGPQGHTNENIEGSAASNLFVEY